MEMASIQTKELHPVAAVHHAQSSRSSFKLKKASNKASIKTEQSCYRCKGNHPASTCSFKNAKCYNCQKVGHIASACRQPKQQKPGKQQRKGAVHGLEASNTRPSAESGMYCVYAATETSRFHTTVSSNGKPIEMQIDTAADRSIMSVELYQAQFSHVPLTTCVTELRTYSGELLEICGQMRCHVQYKGASINLPIIVANYTNKPTVIGRD
ncbi:uncharacterized protein [Diadema antillarum]|uniref:uncharacterized protein n=1 Tax=Diadema antillarum TaxID=105358 RepID=UPI003A870FA6